MEQHRNVTTRLKVMSKNLADLSNVRSNTATTNESEQIIKNCIAKLERAIKLCKFNPSLAYVE